MSPQELVAWMERHQLTLEGAAKILGVAPHIVVQYKTGKFVIPKTFLFACKAYDTMAELNNQRLDKTSHPKKSE